jgi:hypothetical protein
MAGVDTPGSRKRLQINNIEDRISGYRNRVREYAKNREEISKAKSTNVMFLDIIHRFVFIFRR